jgi:hypothetical protein
MDARNLSAQLRAWAREYSSITEEPLSVPEKFWTFLAARLAECGLATEDPDVVVVRSGDSWKKVRITGKRGAMLTAAPADGTLGILMFPIRDVHDDYRGKVTAIIERMLGDGRIGNGTSARSHSGAVDFVSTGPE